MPAAAMADLLQAAVEETAGSSEQHWTALASARVQRVLPASAVLFEDADVADLRTCRVTGAPYAARNEQALREVAREHPMIRSYLAPGASAEPRRMSDLISQRAFERTRTYERLFRPAGMRYQLTILTAGPVGEHMRAWVLNRDDRDFSAAELDIARRLQGLLALLDDAVQRLASQSEKPSEHTTEQYPLTRRELAVLRLVGRGCKADQIGRLLGISPRTVRKHLQNAYAKLGCSDRLLAVDRARRAGLLV